MVDAREHNGTRSVGHLRVCLNMLQLDVTRTQYRLTLCVRGKGKLSMFGADCCDTGKNIGPVSEGELYHGVIKTISGSNTIQDSSGTDVPLLVRKLGIS